MTSEYNQQLKSLFRSNTIDNIKLGITLALGQGYSWNYIAEKCLEEWLLFKTTEGEYYLYYYSPNEYTSINKGGLCSFCFKMQPNHFQTWVQYHNNSIDEGFGVILTSVSLELLKQPIINRMEEFLKLIYENEHDLSRY